MEGIFNATTCIMKCEGKNEGRSTMRRVTGVNPTFPLPLEHIKVCPHPFFVGLD